MDKSFLDLLKKWLSGDFRRADGERLQSMMEGDDFRREAFEGFAENTEAVGEREVSAMRGRFEKKYGKKKGGRSVPMTWLLAAAACSLLVFGTVWLFEKTDEKARGIAMEKPAQNTENQPVEVQSENPGGNPGTAPSPILGEKKLESFSQKRTGNGQDAAQKQATEKPGTADFEKKETVAADEPPHDLKVAEAAPAAAPPIRNESRAEDLDNYQRSQNQQNVPRSLPSDQGANAKPMPKKSGTADKPAAPPPVKTEDLSEVVVSAEAQKAEKLSKKKRADDAAPVTGWAAFNDFISKNKREPVEAQLSNISGTVELKFYIDRDGRPIQILVSKKVGGGCDEEAIRLLESGPNWSPGNREAKVSIDFN